MDSKEISLLISGELTPSSVQAIQDLFAKLEPKEHTFIEVEYSQTGHPQYPEDTWTECHHCENENDLFDFIKFCYKRDARNRTEFPLKGSVSGTFTFKRVTVTTLEYKGKLLKHREEIEVECVEYFTSAWERYKALIDRARKTIPAMRSIRMAKVKEERDQAEYLRLKRKYE